MRGIDVSHHQGKIDWAKVKRAIPPTDFVYIKATEGVGYEDSAFARNVADCREHAIPFGCYHFASLNDQDVGRDARAEADCFHKALQKAYGYSMPPVLDIETNKSCLSPFQVEAWITAFVERMKVLGYQDVVLYSYTPFLDSNLPRAHKLGGMKLWVAAYTKQPKIPHGWIKYWLWQYTCTGTVDGIVGRVDQNKEMDASTKLS